ncbi:MAG: acetyltransferase [Bryobacterales bacterium]|nr:acetyltransferase [Bryobacterales bacterium]
MKQAEQAIAIREIHAHGEFEQAVALQREIWSFADVELIPVRMFVVASKIGGQLLGAFDGQRMVAFLLAVPGIRRDEAGVALHYLHSHMLGVLPAYRDLGLGRKMKLRQREDAIARGIDLVEWTFDPLEARNAFFNIERLGAIVRRYVENQYGRTSSALHGGLPTDRLIAEWWLSSERVVAILAGGGDGKRTVSERVAVPADIGEWKASDPQRARAVQREIATRCQDAFARGLAVVGLERGARDYEYLLGEWA